MKLSWVFYFERICILWDPVFPKCIFLNGKSCVEVVFFILEYRVGFLFFFKRKWMTVFFPTNSIKINRPGHNIGMYRTNFSQPTVHVKQYTFEKNYTKNSSSHLYASFGTFCVQIGPLFEEQWDFKIFSCFHTFFKDAKGVKRSSHFYASFDPFCVPFEAQWDF